MSIFNLNHRHRRMQMNFVGDLLGFGDNAGTNFKASGVPSGGLGLQQGVTQGQIADQYGRTNNALNAQQNFVNALAQQNSIGNLGALYGQQQGLANQFQGVANGTGPNPALQQLQNTTGQNIANQGALMAGQRGAGANVGLLAREAAMQGGSLQQQAVGQGAALQAQQQLAALSGLQNQQSLMGGQQLNQAQLQFGAANQAAGNAAGFHGNLLQGLGNLNSTNAGLQGNINASNAGIANTTAQGQQGILGGLAGGAGSLLGLPTGKAHGGMVEGYADGGPVLQNPFNLTGGPKSYSGNYFSDLSTPSIQPMGMGSIQTAAPIAQAPNSQNPLKEGTEKLSTGLFGALSKLGGGVAGAGGGEGLEAAAVLAKGGAVKKPVDGEALASEAKKVPGKAKVKGDSRKNDTVPAMLSPGEVVIPKSIMESSDPVINAAKFVHAVMMKNRMGRK